MRGRPIRIHSQSGGSPLGMSLTSIRRAGFPLRQGESKGNYQYTVDPNQIIGDATNEIVQHLTITEDSYYWDTGKFRPYFPSNLSDKTGAVAVPLDLFCDWKRERTPLTSPIQSGRGLGSPEDIYTVNIREGDLHNHTLNAQSQKPTLASQNVAGERDLQYNDSDFGECDIIPQPATSAMLSCIRRK
jgi:hypothetical protein